MKRNFLVLVAFAQLFAGASYASCELIDYAGLKKEFGSLASKNIVFFASWCLDCKEKIEKAQEDSLLIAVFDTKERADSIWKNFNNKRSRCFTDKNDSIAKAFNVKSLPFSATTKQLR